MGRTLYRDPGTRKQIQKIIYAKTQKEVRQLLQQKTTAIDEGSYTEPAKMTVGQWLEVWHAESLGGVKQAVMLGYIKVNPTDACVLPRVEKKEVAFIEEDGVKALLKAIEGHRYEKVYKVDLFTGMRQGEILGLTWDCVDFDAGILTVNKQLQKEHVKGGQYSLVSCKTDRVRRIKPAAFIMDTLRQRLGE